MKCRYCADEGTLAIVWSRGRGKLQVCSAHLSKALAWLFRRDATIEAVIIGHNRAELDAIIRRIWPAESVALSVYHRHRHRRAMRRVKPPRKVKQPTAQQATRDLDRQLAGVDRMRKAGRRAGIW